MNCGLLIDPSRTQAEPAASIQPPSETLACPYCDCDLFNRDEALWDHVHLDHAQKIQGSDVKEDTSLFRKLLREEALHKA